MLILYSIRALGYKMFGFHYNKMDHIVDHSTYALDDSFLQKNFIHY